MAACFPVGAIMEFHFSSSLEDEVSYVRMLLRKLEFLRTQNYHVFWPNALKAEIDKGKSEFSEDELRNAVASHELPGASLQRVEQEWKQVEDQFNSGFLTHLEQPLPKFVRVHVTKFGPGGSHNGAPMLPRLIVSFPEMKGLKSNSVLVHEFIEVSLWKRYQAEEQTLGKNRAHGRKEAIVDKLCSCDNLRPVLGEYRKQPGYSDLPDDWQTWLPAKGLTWSK